MATAATTVAVVHRQANRDADEIEVAIEADVKNAILKLRGGAPIPNRYHWLNSQQSHPAAAAPPPFHLANFESDSARDITFAPNSVCA
jgi:hypothetical protein